MLNHFNKIKETVIAKGEKKAEGVWKLESCTFEVVNGEERIFTPGLIHAVNRGGVVSIIFGSEDSFKFLANSI